MSSNISSLPIEEINKIRHLWEALRDDHGEKSPFFSSDFFSRYFENRYALYHDDSRVQNAYIYTAEDCGQIIGYAAGHVNVENIGEIDSLYVLPTHRAKGIGHALVAQLKDALIQAGSVKNRIVVIVGNEQVLPFYEKHGFLPISYTLQDNTTRLRAHHDNENEAKHEKYMRRALTRAEKARVLEEAPIGCIIVHNGKIIGSGYNLRESKQDVTLHAEICAIRAACKKLGSWRLEDCDMYVTLEPCTMCAGAIIQSRIRHVYFGAYDPKTGAVVSTQRLFDLKHNHKVRYTGGVLEDECSQLLKDFFMALRKKKKDRPE